MKEKMTERQELAQSIYLAALGAGFDNCGTVLARQTVIYV